MLNPLGRRLPRATVVSSLVAAVLGTGAFVIVEAEALTTLTLDDLVIRTVPSGFAPPGALTTLDAAVGRTTVGPVTSGEPLTDTRLGPAGVSGSVPQGMVAVDVPAAGVPPGLQPGDHVTVFATYGGARPYTSTAVDDALVRRVGQSQASALGAGPAPASARIELLVWPDEARALAGAQLGGALTIAVLALPGS